MKENISSKINRHGMIGKIATASFVSILVSGCSTLQTWNPGDNGASEPKAAKTSFLSRSNHYPEDDRIQRHLYAGIGIGTSHLNPDASQSSVYDVNDRVQSGGALNVGMDLSRQVSIDLQAVNLGSAGFSPSGSISYNEFSASALLYAGKNRHRYRRTGLSAYGRLGAGYLRNETNGVPFVQENGLHILIGLGAEYMTRTGLGVRAEFISYEEDINYGQLALIYRLGSQEKREPIKVVEAPAPAPVPVAVVEPKPEPVPAPVIEAALPEPNPCDQLNGVLDGVNFHSNSDELTDFSITVLGDVATQLSTCSSAQVTISAHTDSQGAESYNKQLSQRRADSVLRFLSSQGLDTSNMTSTAFGESSPIASNATSEGRAKNRRVELSIIE